ncbi:MAG: glycosyltransferase [Cyclobacteriaceae bacterium]
MVSFIIPVKNGELFIEEAIRSVVENDSDIEHEVIVINDGSEDQTQTILDRLSEKYPQVKSYNNEGQGKVMALNLGFSKSCGNLIKAIDADDILDVNFLNYYGQMQSYDAHIHDAHVVDENMNMCGQYNMQPEIAIGSYQIVKSKLISIPRWSWSMKRKIADKVFPMPDDLPFEDVWFTLCIKAHARSILHIKKPLYYYRQHEHQTFGGVLNYQKKVMNFRAVRLISLLDKLRNHKDRLLLEEDDDFDHARIYLDLIKGDFSLKRILLSSLSSLQKVKLITVCFFPKGAVALTKLKWKLDGLRASVR